MLARLVIYSLFSKSDISLSGSGEDVKLTYTCTDIMLGAINQGCPLVYVHVSRVRPPFVCWEIKPFPIPRAKGKIETVSLLGINAAAA